MSRSVGRAVLRIESTPAQSTAWRAARSLSVHRFITATRGSVRHRRIRRSGGFADFLVPLSAARAVMMTCPGSRQDGAARGTSAHVVTSASSMPGAHGGDATQQITGQTEDPRCGFSSGDPQDVGLACRDLRISRSVASRSPSVPKAMTTLPGVFARVEA